MKIALGPILTFWPREQVLAFYEQAATWPVDIVYLGEVVCSKRRLLRLEDWLSIAERLSATGKQVVLSTLALLEADSELRSLRRIVDNGRYPIEANDMAAVQMAQNRVPYVAGPHLNIYNGETLALHHALGARRWVMPVELSHATLAPLQAQRPAGMQTEVFAFGRLPLAVSARCFTARAHHLPKDDCQLRCLDYPDGMPLNTQEGQPLLTMNGIQTQSAASCNLIGDLPQLRELGVDVVRLSPQAQNMAAIVSAFAAVSQGGMQAEAGLGVIGGLAGGLQCNGYWHGTAGMDWQTAGAACRDSFSGMIVKALVKNEANGV